METFLCFGEKHPDISFIFVNDGSNDGTADLIKQYCGRQIQLLSLPRNFGKAEAVRQGIRSALEQGFYRIGFWDADLSTPLEQICSFLDKMDREENFDMIIGSRIHRLGAHIKRNVGRHIIGRILMSIVYSSVDFVVYDSQCGAKIMTAAVAGAITDKPFITRWLFDLEMLIRLQRVRQQDSLGSIVYEYPLAEWHETGHSKVRVCSVLIDLFRFFFYYKLKKI